MIRRISALTALQTALIASVALDVFSPDASAQNTPRALTDKLVLVVIDGLRYSEGLGDPTRQYVPNMGALADQGTIIEPFLNQGVTLSNRSIPALYTGSYEPPVTYTGLVGENCYYASRPTMHEYFRQQLDRPAADCAFVAGWPCNWGSSYDPAYGPDYWPTVVLTGDLDDANWAAAQTVLATQKPSFLTLYLPATDLAGHSGIWNNYIAKLANADQIVGELWDTLQADPEYAGQTTLIVTNDHGRHDYDFQGHGDGCAGCRTVQFLAVGPGVHSGFVSNVPRSIADLTPTIGALLGFQTEFAQGEVMTEILTRCPEGACNFCTTGTSGASMRIASGASTSIFTNQFTLEATPVPNTSGVFFFGPAQISAPFGAGTRCVGGSVLRLPPASPPGGNAARRTVDFTTPPGSVITPGSQWNFQYWFRRNDLSEGFDLSDGLALSFGP